MRIGLVWISQETDTFNPDPTTLENFASFGIDRGQDIIDHVGTVGVVGGYLAAAEARGGVDTVPIFKARAVAGGRLDRATLDYLAEELRTGLEKVGALDGLALQLHGACSADGVDDVDGYLISVARKVVGPDLPIVLTLDHHANITQSMIDGSNGLVGFRTQPHDPFGTGESAADLLFRIVAGEVDPTVAWRKIPLISHQEQYLTSKAPMRTWFDRARELEKDPRVLRVSNFPMQPWLDVDEGGWSTVVVTDNDPELAERLADELGDLAWSLRADFQVKTSLSVAEAVARAESADSGVVVISDTGDSVLGGAGGDSTVLVREMLTSGITGPALIPLVEPQIAEKVAGFEVGSEVSITVGGGLAKMHEPIELSGTLISAGPAVVEIGGGYSSPVVDLGFVAIVDIACGTVAITQLPGVGGVHPDMYHHFGIDPATYKMAVVKTASNFQYFADISSEVVRADTAGPTQSDIKSLPWKRIPRPVYPLDEISDWR